MVLLSYIVVWMYPSIDGFNMVSHRRCLHWNSGIRFLRPGRILDAVWLQNLGMLTDSFMCLFHLHDDGDGNGCFLSDQIPTMDSFNTNTVRVEMSHRMRIW